MPVFSVVIPLYNKEADIVTTVRSVLEQDFRDLELLVVDDGSTDKGLELVQRLDDSRIRTFSRKNEGVAAARNFGVQRAQGNLIAFLDADDLWLPHHLSDLHRLVELEPDAGWYATAYKKRYNKNLVVPLESPIMERKDWFGRVEDYFGYCLVESIAWTSAVCFRRDFFLELDGFDSSIAGGACGEDTDLWIRAALVSAPAFTTRISAVYNLEGSNRISLTPTPERTFMDPDRYEEAAAKDPHLKNYLDLNRYSFALQHKMAGDHEGFRRYAKKLDRSNLNSKQRLLLGLPRGLLQLAVGFQEMLAKAGIRLSTFK